MTKKEKKPTPAPTTTETPTQDLYSPRDLVKDLQDGKAGFLMAVVDDEDGNPRAHYWRGKTDPVRAAGSLDLVKRLVLDEMFPPAPTTKTAPPPDAIN
jgi:hypothetical protein